MKLVNSGISLNEITLIILSHLDDEFALAPVIKMLSINSNINSKLKFIYCAERCNSDIKIQKRRRKENKKALKLLGCGSCEIIYLNDSIRVDDTKLYLRSSEIYNILQREYKRNSFKQILTLAYEGGHPDHDALALIVWKFSRINKLITFYFPAYNNRKTLFNNVSVLRPLKEQMSIYTKINLGIFDWFIAIRLAILYTTERQAFLKIIPFLIIKNFIYRSIYISNKLDIDTVNIDNNLTVKRYNVRLQRIHKQIEML